MKSVIVLHVYSSVIVVFVVVCFVIAGLVWLEYLHPVLLKDHAVNKLLALLNFYPL